MKILMVSSEAVPFSKSGGLADVVGALPQVLNAKAHDCRIIVPAYNMKREDCGKVVASFSIKMLSSDCDVEIRSRVVNNTEYLFVCNSFFNDRKGIYGDTSFTPYEDNFERFTVLSKAAIKTCKALSFIPDIIHCHDWTTGLLPYFLDQENDYVFRNTKTVFTIHNLAYQGTFSRMNFLLSGEHSEENIFMNNQVNMLRCGLIYSDFITTVSPTYANEIQTKEQGCGLDDLLVSRKNDLKGIVNGIDINEWNPSSDPLIDNHFSLDDLSGKRILKRQIQREFNLEQDDNIPLFAMISRLASQKGFDVLCDALENILTTQKVQFIIIGTGDKTLEERLKDIALRNKNLSVNIMFSNKAAHLVEAGSDFFVMPSRYEPCGLNQLYSLRYGTLPIARRTGGLADTIIDLNTSYENGTGFLFDNLVPEEITKQVENAVKLYHKPEFKSVIKRAMNQDFSWSKSADDYLKVFSEILEKK